MTLYIAAYDVADDRDRLRIAKILQRLGPRLQDSVFEIQLEPNQVDKLIESIGILLAPADAFDLVPIDQRRPERRLRWRRAPPTWEPVVTLGRAFGWRKPTKPEEPQDPTNSPMSSQAHSSTEQQSSNPKHASEAPLPEQ